ncbi:MAG: penicillin-binding protein 2 [Lachnospiraceae bacterium]|nr:penicillin-binding protein 2 [Lachnospiraceae bacterium]
MKRMQSKLFLVFILLCILFVVLIGRLMYIEYTSGAKYEKIVLSQQQYDSKTIPYQRGNIYDSRGTVLATCIDVYNIILDCKVLNAQEDKKDSTISYLCQCFPELNQDEIEDALENDPASQYKVLAKGVSYDEMNSFKAIMENEDTADEVAGVWFEKEYERKYPYGNFASQLIGFSSASSGVIGIETQYDDVLSGTNGRSYGYYNSDKDVEQKLVEPVNGNNVVTTIDANIQSIVEEAVLNANNEMLAEATTLEKYQEFGVTTGSDNTSVIVMNPNNGEILAMATYPGFDLNNPKDLSLLYTPEQLEKMSDEEEMNALNNLWQNYATSKTFEPGSTFKPFTVAMGLDTGKLNGDETYVCDGSEVVSGHEIHCVNTSGHGTETIEKALMDSCNDALMQMSYAIGGDTFAEYQSIFGFGQKTGIDLPGEASTATLIYDKDQLNKTASNLATNSFGQGFNVTMIQLASSFCSLVNGGDLYQPHVLKQITDDSGNVVKTIEPVVLKETISQKTSDILRGYLKSVVDAGTGKKASVEGYSIGGKTGTAEKLPRGSGEYVVSIITFAPVEDPQVVVFVAIDNPHVEDQSHCSQASYITKNIMSQLLPYLGIEQTNFIEEGNAEYPEEAGLVQQETPAAEDTNVPADT